MDEATATAHKILVKSIKTRVQSYSLAYAIQACKSQHFQSQAMAVVNILTKELLFAEGFKAWFPRKKVIKLEDLHGLIQDFYSILVKNYCRSAREVLSNGSHSRLKDTYVQMLFPSTIKRNEDDYYVMNIITQPVILALENGDEVMGALLWFETLGACDKDSYFQITPFVKRSKDNLELVKESNKVVELAAPYILEKLHLLTEAEWDVLQLLNMGWSNERIAKKLKITLWTVKTHRSNISEKVKSIARISDRAFGQKMLKIKVI